jgi:PAS domain S-box-containing protein
MGEIRILIVDDNQANLIALEAVLKSLNYHLIFASSGEDALRCLMKDDFAMILLDVQMPGMDGFETARLIRARRKNKNIPIIFITAICKSEENISQGYNLGAIDYLFKPFHPETLKLKVEAFVKMHLQSQQTMLQNIFLERLGSKLRKTSQKLTNILESITDVFFTLNHQWEFIFVNEEAEKFWQKSKGELIGRNIWELFPALPPEHYSFFTKAMTTKKAMHFEHFHSDILYEVHVYPSDEGVSINYHDISIQRMFKKEIACLERLDLVGKMAVGIGHEIRNPMTTVRGFLQLLGEKEEVIQFKGYCELMIEELDRANAIITEFIGLAKNKVVHLQPLSMNRLIENLYPLIQAEAIASNKDIIMDLREMEVLLLDEQEIYQLISNLVRNGMEAMPAGGKLTIRTFKDGEDAVLAVGDEGSGIKTEDLEKIGTPFFTTKENRTGLGLATCFSISARHNATIQINSSPSGTTFFVRFKQQKKIKSA